MSVVFDQSYLFKTEVFLMIFFCKFTNHLTQKFLNNHMIINISTIINNLMNLTFITPSALHGVWRTESVHRRQLTQYALH